jgi:hypothetical protein
MRPSKRLWPWLVAIPLILALVAGLVWASGLLYWHFTLTAALRELEDDMTALEPGKPDSYTQLIAPEMALDFAGCRSLPYYVGALDPARKIFLLNWCSKQLWSDERRSFDDKWVIHTTDSPEGVASKCRKIREWWSQHGREYHQAWRWWSDDCRSQR